VVQDAYGNRRVDKAKSTERVDGVVALLMALGRAMMGAPEEGVIVWVPGT
jgi:phage terminase large subunit-like protein